MSKYTFEVNAQFKRKLTKRSVQTFPPIISI
jgi:hypothetical protein